MGDHAASRVSHLAHCLALGMIRFWEDITNMDGQRFDAWTLALAKRWSRRHAVKILVGAGAAGVAIRAVVQEAEACLEDGQYCTNNEECCDVCIAFACTACLGKGQGTCDGPHDCCGGKMDCVNGKCTKKKSEGKQSRRRKRKSNDTGACSVNSANC